MGRTAYHTHEEHFNPMGSVDEIKSPLEKYRHLLPNSTKHVNSLDQHFFLVNVNALFPTTDPESLRVTVAHTTDQAYHPGSALSEQRHLFYAALLNLGPSAAKLSFTTLAKGPAVPYFSPSPEAVPASSSGKSSWSLSGAKYSPTEDAELREAKEKAVSLLMEKLADAVHDKLISDGDGEVEVWDAKGWKYAESRETSGTGSVKGENGRWFSKR